jgi:hypothetical protein
LDELKVFCLNKANGCEAIVERGGMQDHLTKTCVHHCCVNTTAGCVEKGSKAALSKHIDEVCAFVSLKCPNGCKYVGTRQTMPTHLAEQCERTPCRHQAEVGNNCIPIRS